MQGSLEKRKSVFFFSLESFLEVNKNLPSIVCNCTLDSHFGT